MRSVNQCELLHNAYHQNIPNPDHDGEENWCCEAFPIPQAVQIEQWSSHVDLIAKTRGEPINVESFTPLSPALRKTIGNWGVKYSQL